MEDILPVKVHCFTGSVNFIQFYNGFIWSDDSKARVKPLLDNYNTYVNACCNKNTWLKILNTVYEDFVVNTAKYPPLIAEIKDKAAVDKIIFMDGERILAELT